jgi:hypothetical protein
MSVASTLTAFHFWDHSVIMLVVKKKQKNAS